MTRWLVTGGSGFIGSALVRRLAVRGDDVCNLDHQTYAASPEALRAVRELPNYRLVIGDIADPRIVDATIDEFEPDVIVNLAAESHVDRSIDGPLPFIRTNVTGAATLLESARRYWVRSGLPGWFRFLHVSTDEVFGSIEEGSFGPSSPYQPRSPYAASKAAGDHLARAWWHTYRLPTIVTNCSNNYGPFQYPEKLIPLMTIRSARGEALPVYGDGSQVRDWIHVDDHVDGLLAAADRGRPGDTYLFGSRSEKTNLSLVHEIAGLVAAIRGADYQPRIEFVTDRPGHDSRYSIDPTRTETALDWRATTPFASGLAETVAWYLDHREWWEPLVASGAVERKGTADA